MDIKKIIYLKSTLKLSEDKKLKANDIFICLSSGSKKHIGKVTFIDKDSSYYAGGFMGIIRSNNKINSKYLYTLLRHPNIKKMMEINSTGNNINNLYNQLNNIKLPLPPMDIQEKIVKEIENINNTFFQRYKMVKDKKAEISTILNSFNTGHQCRLGNVLSLEYGISLPKYKRIKGIYPVVGANGIDGFHNSYFLNGPSIIVGRKGSVGKINLIKQNCTPIDTCFFVKINEEQLLFQYTYYLLKSLNLETLNKGLGPGGLNRNDVYALSVEVPSLDLQKEIVAQILPLEEEIEKLQKEIDEIPAKKQAILDKYLK